MPSWTNTTFGTIPSGYRPITNICIPTRSRSNVPVEININTDGACFIYTPSNTVVAVNDVFGTVISYIKK